MQSVLITPSTTQLITLQEAKDYLHVTHDYEDDLITKLIPSCVARCEAAARMSFGLQTWESTIEIPTAKRDCLLPGYAALLDSDSVYARMILPKKPAVAVLSINSLNSRNGETQLVDTEHYTLLNGRLLWKDTFWAEAIGYNIMTVQYTAGFATAEEFKARFPDIWEAILMTLDNAYNRGETGSLTTEARRILYSHWTSPTYE